MKKNTAKTIKFFIKHIKTCKRLLFIMILASTMGVAVSMFIPILYKEFFDVLVAKESKDVLVNTLFKIILIIFGLNLVEIVCWRIAGFLNNRFQPRIIGNIIGECFEYIHKHSFNFFNNNFTGALVKRIHRMAGAFESISDKFYWELLPLILKILIVLGVLSYLHPILGIIILIWVIIFIILSYIVTQYKLKFDIKRAKADTAITAYLADTITNNINLKLFSGLSFEKLRFSGVLKKWYERVKKAWDIDTIVDGVQGLLMTLLEIVVMYIAIKLWQKGELTVGDFALIQSYLLEIFIRLWGIGRLMRDLYEHFADAEEMTIILNTPIEISDKPHAKEINITHGRIIFDNVVFSYENGSDVIENLSFKVKAGEKIALIGPSGGGKTTIAKLLLRLHNIKKGKILIDDQNIKDVTQDSLRKEVSLVPQDPVLFHRSLMENIRYGRRNASEEEIIEASKLAHCHEFILKFKKGYGTFVGERGIKLSGGERQRVAIARAILSNTKILVLDEATSHLDSESEKLIQDALKNLIKNKTTFIIAHRLSTIMQSDRIFVIKDGKIIEEGVHEDLINKKKGLYRRLWTLQVGGYLNE